MTTERARLIARAACLCAAAFAIGFTLSYVFAAVEARL